MHESISLAPYYQAEETKVDNTLIFFHMLGGSLQPLTHRLFFNSFDAMNRGEAIAIC